ncbi:MAG TPA: glutamate 5-kinase [Actinomycetota bacterium]|nr:glutamate 5-kinase [Actinomycetota bacterium]
MARPSLEPTDRLVVKVGTASLVGSDGRVDQSRLTQLCSQLSELKMRGSRVALVSSGAIAAGLGPLGIAGRPTDIPSLQAAAAVGQGHLLESYARLFGSHGQVVAQLLLTRYDFMHRQQYLNARNTMEKLFELGAIPIVNENDTIAVDEIRFGDNDLLAALVANLARAKLLLLLTDARGLHSADPRQNPDAPIIEEVERITPELERAAGGRGSDLSTGGMASKIAAAWVATFSGVGVIVADAADPEIVDKVARGEIVGTYFHPHPTRASARRLWIAFGQPPRGTIVVDEGARRAVTERKSSLLPVGVVEVRGGFKSGDTVDVAAGGRVFARGLVRYDSQELEEARGRSTAELAGKEVIHRDQLIVLEAGTG